MQSYDFKLRLKNKGVFFFSFNIKPRVFITISRKGLLRCNVKTRQLLPRLLLFIANTALFNVFTACGCGGAFYLTRQTSFQECYDTENWYAEVEVVAAVGTSKVDRHKITVLINDR